MTHWWHGWIWKWERSWLFLVTLTNNVQVFLQFSNCRKNLVWLGVKRPEGTIKYQQHSERVTVLSCYQRRNRWFQSGNKKSVHGVKLLALGWCTWRLSRKVDGEKKLYAAHTEQRAFHSTLEKQKSESQRFKNQTESSHDWNRCLDLFDDQ